MSYQIVVICYSGRHIDSSSCQRKGQRGGVVRGICKACDGSQRLCQSILNPLDVLICAAGPITWVLESARSHACEDLLGVKCDAASFERSLTPNSKTSKQPCNYVDLDEPLASPKILVFVFACHCHCMLLTAPGRQRWLPQRVSQPAKIE